MLLLSCVCWGTFKNNLKQNSKKEWDQNKINNTLVEIYNILLLS